MNHGAKQRTNWLIPTATQHIRFLQHLQHIQNLLALIALHRMLDHRRAMIKKKRRGEEKRGFDGAPLKWCLKNGSAMRPMRPLIPEVGILLNASNYLLPGRLHGQQRGALVLMIDLFLRVFSVVDILAMLRLGPLKFTSSTPAKINNSLDFLRRDAKRE
jgi:hypothetical protein